MGLSDFLFDDTQNDKDSTDTSNSNSSKNQNMSDDEDINANGDNDDAESINSKELSQNLLNYYFISNSRQLDCYVIDKEYYLKYMQTFTEDKNIISKYLQSLVINPTIKLL